MTINRSLGIYLLNAQKNKKRFNIKDFGLDRKEILANLFFKNIIESEKELGINITKIGLSLDLNHAPISSKALNEFAS